MSRDLPQPPRQCRSSAYGMRRMRGVRCLEWPAPAGLQWRSHRDDHADGIVYATESVTNSDCRSARRWTAGLQLPGACSLCRFADSRDRQRALGAPSRSQAWGFARAMRSPSMVLPPLFPAGPRTRSWRRCLRSTRWVSNTALRGRCCGRQTSRPAARRS